MSLVAPVDRWVTLLLGAVLAFSGMADVLCAQRDDVIVEGPAAVEPDNVALRRQAVLIELRMRGVAPVQISDDTVYQWVFGDARNADAAMKQLELTLRTKVDELAFPGAASDAQKKKLELAGQVDIRRFLERVDDLKRQGQEIKGDAKGSFQLHQQAQILQLLLKGGLFNDESLFAKTARHVFTSEQLERADRERTAFQHRAQVERAAALLQNALRMTDQQEQTLVTLLLAETRPPRQPGVYGFQVVMFEMMRLPESKLKPLFSDQQWDLLNRQFEQVKWMEPSLRQSGVLHELEPAATKAVK